MGFRGQPELRVGVDGNHNRYLMAYMLVYERVGNHYIIANLSGTADHIRLKYSRYLGLFLYSFLEKIRGSNRNELIPSHKKPPKEFHSCRSRSGSVIVELKKQNQRGCNILERWRNLV